jgi:hypothetical protein
VALTTSNTTCDIYRGLHSPPSVPDVAGVKCLLTPDFASGHLAAVTPGTTGLRWTHVLLVGPAVDIRDEYPSNPTNPGLEQSPSSGIPDHLYVPDKGGTEFVVIFVERLGRGTLGDCKRVYLQREAPTWPSNDL